MRKKLLVMFMSIIAVVAMVFSISGCQITINDDNVIIETDYKEVIAEETVSTTNETTKDTQDVTTETEATEDETTLPEETTAEITETTSDLLDVDGSYTSKDDVALYIYQYGELPQNFMTKSDARDLGWQGGSLEDFATGMCIGGDYFGNYEGLLPEKKGREYHECDIDTLGAKSRGAKRIIYSNDGLIYYTDDHYETFTLLYGEE